MTTTFLDIETASLPPDQLAKVKPEFTAAKNLKDPAKIAADIAEKEQAWLDRAALDAVSGQVLCIGTLGGPKDFFPLHSSNEVTTLTLGWQWLEQTLAAGNQVVGFCIFHFDLPFLIRRSYIHNVRVPGAIRRGRYWADGLIDIADIWACGNRDQTISLDRLAKVLGVPAKLGSGADFAGLWQTDREAALAYLKRDCEIVRDVYQRMI